MYRLRLYCWAILNGGRFGDLRTIYQGCRALPFALAGLSCMSLEYHCIYAACHFRMQKSITFRHTQWCVLITFNRNGFADSWQWEYV